MKSADSPDPEESLPGTSNVPIIRAAILGSILANLLLCLGFCFFVGGLNTKEQEFDEAVSEVGSGLLLVAGFGLLIPSAFFNSLYGGVTGGQYPRSELEDKVLTISRATSVILLAAFCIYVFFQMRYLYRRPCSCNLQLTDMTGVTMAYTKLCSRRTRRRTRTGIKI